MKKVVQTRRNYPKEPDRAHMEAAYEEAKRPSPNIAVMMFRGKLLVRELAVRSLSLQVLKDSLPL